MKYPLALTLLLGSLLPTMPTAADSTLIILNFGFFDAGIYHPGYYSDGSLIRFEHRAYDRYGHRIYRPVYLLPYRPLRLTPLPPGYVYYRHTPSRRYLEPRHYPRHYNLARDRYRPRYPAYYPMKPYRPKARITGYNYHQATGRYRPNSLNHSGYRPNRLGQGYRRGGQIR
ncbi:MAG: hypothetical protein DHS20C01_12500 [marine bacterium B5-7]|nr:MAG: hypothetical protein DHS20C01_12500 [marine bacterium B5-7]